MPEYIAVKCCNEPQCGMFQVVQKRKDSKWTCSICATKQSIVKAADVRDVVKKYNMDRGIKMEKAPPKRKLEDADEEIEGVFEDYTDLSPIKQDDSKPSKWLKYLDSAELKEEEEEESEDLTSNVATSKGRGAGRRNNENTKNRSQNFVDDWDSLAKFSTQGRGSNSTNLNNKAPNDLQDKHTKSIATDWSSKNRNQTFSPNYPTPYGSTFPKATMIQEQTEKQAFKAPESLNKKSKSKTSIKPIQSTSSKWSKFLDENDQDNNSDQDGDDFVTNESYHVVEEEIL